MGHIDFSRLGELDLPSEEARLFARELVDRFPTLRLVTLKPGDEEYDRRRPYAVIDTEPLTLHRIIKLLPLTMLNYRGLAEILDNRVRALGGITPDRYWALREADNSMRARRRAEERAEKRELLLVALKSPLHWFKYHDGEVDDTIVLRK